MDELLLKMPEINLRNQKVKEIHVILITARIRDVTNECPCIPI